MKLRNRLERLERRAPVENDLRTLTDTGLMAAILRACLEREPTDGEVVEWMALPDNVFRDRMKAMGVTLEEWT